MTDAGGRARPPVVVLHERSGVWARQLRARLGGVRARWVETRLAAELLVAVAGIASPVVVVEAGADPAAALRDLAILAERASAPYILFIDPRARPEALRLAGELGATLALGRPTPPEAAELVGRWLDLATRALAREGWSRSVPADPAREVDEWLEEVVAAAAAGMDS